MGPVIYGLYLSAAGAQVQDYRKDVIANNLANVNTNSFKRDLALFRQRLAETRESGRGRQYSVPMLDRIGGGVFPGPTATDFAQGPVRRTSSGYDVAVIGDGFLMVADDSAQYLTRDGGLALNVDSELTMSGRRVLDTSGRPIAVDPALPLTISPDGDVRQGGETIARLALVDVADRRQLRKQGGNLYALAPGQRPTAASGTIRQGFLEGSAVDPIKELVALIEASRAFEANMNMVRYQDATLTRLVNDVARAG